MKPLLLLLSLLGCADKRRPVVDPADSPADSAAEPDGPVPWSAELAPLSEMVEPVRGLVAHRAIVHLHSPWSHDACDGEGLVEGVVNGPCLADLREALCRTAIDIAFFTDHPAHAAEQDWEDLFHAQDGDERLPGDAGQTRAIALDCSAWNPGHRSLWMPGIEDELMPVGLDRHAGATPEDNDAIYNGGDADALRLEAEAGATVLLAHTEGRDGAQLEMLQDAGLVGLEIFNLHAAFAPDIRRDDLGLEPMGWLAEIAPFTDLQGSAEPDLLFLAVLQEQSPSLAAWDALLARGPMVAVAGTDAHQNILPTELKDGERADSYRRMLRWFSNVILSEQSDPVALEAALGAGRVYVAFEALGTPAGVDLHLLGEDDATWEMGSTAPPGTLHVGCPSLATGSPRGAQAPEITVTVFKDGAPWQTGCGDFAASEAGSYRVRVDLVPHHLADFLGEDPTPWLKPLPWVYTNAIRVEAGP